MSNMTITRGAQMMQINRYFAALTPRDGDALAARLPAEAGLYCLALHLSDGRSIPLRVGIATGKGGLRSRICLASSSHYASVCADQGASIARAYPNYWGFFRRIAAWRGAETSWTVLTSPDSSGEAWSETVRVLERALIDELQPIWEEPRFKSKRAFVAAPPDLGPLVEAWWARHGDKAPWDQRLDTLVREVEGRTPNRRELRRVTLELSPDALDVLEGAAADQRRSMAEVVELLVRRELGDAAAARRVGVLGQGRDGVVKGASSDGRGRLIAEVAWAELEPRLARRGVQWDGDKARGKLSHPQVGRVISDLNTKTMKGYIYPPPTYARPPHLTVYKADNAINVRELTIDELDALLDALQVPRG
jgi:hypothetical protein